VEVISGDIHNQTAKIAPEIRQGKVPNEALIKELTKDLFFEYSLSKEGRIQKSFLVYIRYASNLKFKVSFKCDFAR
jgi:hypothetical protein